MEKRGMVGELMHRFNFTPHGSVQCLNGHMYPRLHNLLIIQIKILAGHLAPADSLFTIRKLY